MAGWLGVTFAHARSKESGACHRAERELVLGAPVVGFGASRPCSSAGVAEVFASASQACRYQVGRSAPLSRDTTKRTPLLH